MDHESRELRADLMGKRAVYSEQLEERNKLFSAIQKLNDANPDVKPYTVDDDPNLMIVANQQRQFARAIELIDEALETLTTNCIDTVAIRKLTLEMEVLFRKLDQIIQGQKTPPIEATMIDKPDTKNSIDTIIDNARKHFPGSDAQIISENDQCWVLLIRDSGLTHRYSAPNITALARMSADLLEYEDEQDEWEMQQNQGSNG